MVDIRVSTTAPIYLDLCGRVSSHASHATLHPKIPAIRMRRLLGFVIHVPFNAMESTRWLKSSTKEISPVTVELQDIRRQILVHYASILKQIRKAMFTLNLLMSTINITITFEIDSVDVDVTTIHFNRREQCINA
jgi:hypothetical protein